MINALIYCLAVWIANYTATMFLPFPVFGMVSIGTLIFGVTFTQRDRVHQHGRRAVYLMILVAAIGMVIESIILHVPYRIIAASFTAIVIAEAADTEIYQRNIERSWVERVTRSNMVSIPLDSVLFNGIAFLGVFAPIMLAQIVFGEIVVKFLSGWIASLWKRQN